jgi:hypothetical protein
MNHVFYISAADHHVCELYYDNGRWLPNDLTAATNGPQASNVFPMPPGVGTIAGFFDGSIEHVFYVSTSDNHVRELYYDGSWQPNDLTAVTNSPPAGGSLTGFFANGIEHVFYVSPEDGHVRELYYFGGSWLPNDLTVATNGVNVNNSWLTSFFADGVEHVFYRNQSGYVCELYYLNGRWWGNNLTLDTGGPATEYPVITSFSGRGIEHVFYQSQVGDHSHVCELYYNGSWWGNDLTAVTSGPEAPGTGITSLFDGSVEHVYYLGGPAGGPLHVHELYYNGAWWGNDLTAAANAGYPFQSITSLFDGMQHVFYIGQTSDPYTNAEGWGHVYELYYDGAWHVNDLTGTSGPAALAGPITCFSTP